MAAFNVVRFRVKPGLEKAFVEAHRKIGRPFKGFLGGHLVKTGNRTYCMVGEWRDFKNLVDARPAMIAILDRFRHMLEDLGSGLGLTDPVSGSSVAKLAGGKKPAAKKKAGGKKKAGAKKAVTKKKAASRRAAPKRRAAASRGAKRKSRARRAR